MAGGGEIGDSLSCGNVDGVCVSEEIGSWSCRAGKVCHEYEGGGKKREKK